MLAIRTVAVMPQAMQRQPSAPDEAADPGPPDQVLVARIRAGDSSALGLLYDRYARTAMGVAFRVVEDRQLAEDVVHDAFVTAWRKIDRFDDRRGSLRVWLLSVVRNRAIDRLRAGRRVIGSEAAVEVEERSTGGNPTWDAAVANLSRDQVRAAISQLPPDQLRAVELAYFGGLTYREIARVTEVPEGTASSRLRLALGKLRDALRGTDAAPWSGDPGAPEAPRAEVDA